MARTTDTIHQNILDAIAATPELGDLNSTSQTAIYRLLAFIWANQISNHEQLWDIYKTDLENIAAQAVAGTPQYLKNKALEFQYGSTVQANGFVMKYPVEIPEQKIITRCAIKENEDGSVLLKLAKGTTVLEKLTVSELAAFKSYINKVWFAGVKLNPISLDADRLMVGAEIYYDAEYIESTVKANVIAAINTFLSTIEFDGTIYLTKLVDAIQAVAGVKDVKLNQVKGRDYITAITDGSVLPISRVYETYSGYIIPEDTAGYTLNDTITMIA